jgi:hypothetical protein
MADTILKQNSRSPHMPLMEFYLYPPKYISSAAIATLAPPPNRQQSEAELYRTSKPELSGEKLALNYIKAIQQTSDDRLSSTAAASPRLGSRLNEMPKRITPLRPRFGAPCMVRTAHSSLHADPGFPARFSRPQNNSIYRVNATQQIYYFFIS